MHRIRDMIKQLVNRNNKETIMRKEDIELGQLEDLISDDKYTLDLEDYFLINDLKQRKLFIDLPIEHITILDIIRYILQYNKDDKGLPTSARKPILLYITSNGGEIDAGFELIDVIRSSKTPVYTINIGYQYSMACLIGIAGHKRYATKNAKFLLHDGSDSMWDSASKVEDYMEFQKVVSRRIKEYVIDRTKITEEEFDSKRRVEWYMFANEAREKGLCDYIIGEDCDLDEVI